MQIPINAQCPRCNRMGRFSKRLKGGAKISHDIGNPSSIAGIVMQEVEVCEFSPEEADKELSAELAIWELTRTKKR